MRTIQVKGTGRVKHKPDTIEINMTLKLENKDYEKAMENSNSSLEILRADLLNVGFSSENIKTTNFNVESAYESVKNNKGEYVREFRGYQCVHCLRLQFTYNTDILAKTISALSKSSAKTEFSIEFTVKDRNKLTSALLASAVENATNNAISISNSARLILGEIQNIVYDFVGANMYSNTKFKPMMLRSACADTSAMNIEPEDVTLSDDVTITWEIK